MFQMAKQLCFEQQLCQFPACPAGVSVMLKTHHWEENISFTVSLKRSKTTDTCFLFHVTPKQTRFYVFTLCSLPHVNTIFFCPPLSRLYRVYFIGVHFTWPPERERNWQPSRPEAWRATLQGRRDPGRRSSQVYVPETHKHIEAKSWKPV